MIFDAPQVKVAGIKYPVYSADFTWGGADSPSTIVITYINKNGEYRAPSLNTTTPTKIQIDNFFYFNGYPVNWKKDSGPNGKTLTVKYVDTSTILDKIYVGLKGVHGAGQAGSEVVSYGQFNNIILLGDAIDPCEGITDEYSDPCSPCVSYEDIARLQGSNTEKRVKCETERQLRILQVQYTFTQLIAGLAAKGIKFDRLPVFNPDIYATQTGTARSVLKYWADQLGFIFYWNKDTINFIDAKRGITINDTNFYDSCNLTSFSESESIENNVAVGNILYFGAEGELRNYPCSNSGANSMPLALRPITLKDLFWNDKSDGIHPYIAKYYAPVSKTSLVALETCCTLSKYSPTIRDMVTLYDGYDVDKIEDIVKGTKFDLLGLEILEVAPLSKLDIAKQAYGKIFFRHFPLERQTDLLKKYGNIVKVKYKEATHQKLLEFEKRLADNFIGKYWIRFFSKGDRFSYNSPDGSPKYNDAGSIVTLPFMDVVPESMLGRLDFLQNLINNDKPAATGDEDTLPLGTRSTNNPNSFRHSFLLLERNAAWEPTESSEEMRKIDTFLQDIHFLSTQSFLSQAGELTGGSELKEGESYIIMFDKPEGFSFAGGTIEGPHPIEAENTNIPTDLGGIQSHYGIRANLCHAFQIKLKGVTTDIYSPVQAYGKFGREFAGYTVFAQALQGNGIEGNVLLGKKEVIFGDVPLLQTDVVGLDINFRDLTSYINEILETTGEKKCGYRESVIREFIREFFVKIARDTRKIESTKTYSLSGFPTRELKLEDGLSGFSMRFDSTNGVTSDIQFSNYPPLFVDERVKERDIINNLIKRYMRNRAPSSANKILIN